ncbi:hypothetical protein, partial [Pseudomonas aeruginosa]|uniref:hypothetical protein n=1 Tax=Pseudomonas aeruginosa TaxID=287 RepID=UPI003457F9A6
RPWLCGMMLQFQFNDRVALSSCNRHGFSGNYDNYNSPQPRYPRQLRITAPEIPASLRDEYSPEIGASFRVSVPDDLLEM